MDNQAQQQQQQRPQSQSPQREQNQPDTNCNSIINKQEDASDNTEIIMDTNKMIYNMSSEQIQDEQSTDSHSSSSSDCSSQSRPPVSPITPMSSSPDQNQHDHHHQKHLDLSKEKNSINKVDLIRNQLPTCNNSSAIANKQQLETTSRSGEIKSVNQEQEPEEEENNEEEDEEMEEEDEDEDEEALSNQVSQPESPEDNNDDNGGGDSREKSPESQQDDISSPSHTTKDLDKNETTDNNNQLQVGNTSQDEGQSSTLGRNKRVRQKNRYFSDFHCIDLTKGVRSREDLSYSQSTNIRSSTRRSTTDSNRETSGADYEPEEFETKYCRKCGMKTAHDPDGGCQVCLYHKIISASKKLKSGGRSRSRPQKQTSQTSSSKDNNDTPQQTRTSSARAAANNKRRSGGPAKPAKSSKQNNTNKIVNNNLQNDATYSGPTSRPGTSSNNNPGNGGSIINEDNKDDKNSDEILSLNKTSPIHIDTNRATSTIEPTRQSSLSTTTTCSSSNNINNNNNNNNLDSVTKLEKHTNDRDITNDTYNGFAAKLPKLDSWSPDEVANYILSNGFSFDEAELFKSQKVDGISLLLMQRTDFTYGLKLKLGPALKIYDQVCKLKRDYFRTITAT